MDAGDCDETRERLAALGEIAAEIAHELSNVLQIISASAYGARQEMDRANAAAARPHIAKVEKHARLAHSIVDDLMLLARGHVRWAEPVLLTDILTAARSDLSPSGAPDVALWKDDVTPADLRIGAHPGLSTRLLHALYENAIHASAPRVPRITTRARAESERVVVEVGDDGPGIPPQLAARIFDPLVTARPGGTGLGLALARRIAAAHGGTVELLESREGAHFRIELPRTA